MCQCSVLFILVFVMRGLDSHVLVCVNKCVLVINFLIETGTIDYLWNFFELLLGELGRYI